MMPVDSPFKKNWSHATFTRNNNKRVREIGVLIWCNVDSGPSRRCVIDDPKAAQLARVSHGAADRATYLVEEAATPSMAATEREALLRELWENGGPAAFFADLLRAVPSLAAQSAIHGVHRDVCVDYASVGSCLLLQQLPVEMWTRILSLVSVEQTPFASLDAVLRTCKLWRKVRGFCQSHEHLGSLKGSPRYTTI
jgi:hypothetical protein